MRCGQEIIVEGLAKPETVFDLLRGRRRLYGLNGLVGFPLTTGISSPDMELISRGGHQARIICHQRHQVGADVTGGQYPLVGSLRRRSPTRTSMSPRIVGRVVMVSSWISPDPRSSMSTAIK